MLIFPEGRRSETGEIDAFRPGIGMIASRLGVPVVPVRIDGLEHVLHVGWRMARPGRVRVAFGAPLRLIGDDYEALAKQVEDAVRRSEAWPTIRAFDAHRTRESRRPGGLVECIRFADRADQCGTMFV